MKANLKINKDIIEDFYRNNKHDDSDRYINKLKEEIKLLNKANDKNKEEIYILRNKVGYYEQITNDNLMNYKENTENLKNRLFILENSVKKKDNIIQSLNNRLNKFIEREIFNDYLNIVKETYVQYYNIDSRSYYLY